MEIEIEFFSQQIKSLREARQLTQEELAQTLGVSRQSIISLERGKCLPSLPLALSLANTFDLALENFFCPQIENNQERREVIKVAHDLTPFTPMRDLNRLHESLDRLFEESLPTMPKMSMTMPSVNILEKENVLVVEADVPGVRDEDLSIEVGEDYVLISGKRESREEVNDENYHRREVSYGSFSRTIGLPAQIDKDNAEAELKDGTLRVTLPKVALVEPKVTKLKINTK